jgi:hypothetical protein
MAVRGRRAQANQPPAALEKELRDIEMDDLRRQIQQLQDKYRDIEMYLCISLV